MIAACHARSHSTPAEQTVVLAPAETTAVEQPPRRVTRALTPADRDSLVREVTARREAWRARGIRDYRILVAAGCFCPWPGNPAILEVRDGVARALYDTTGKSLGAPREPWSLYTVEGLFDQVERHARSSDVIEVVFDGRYGYPTSIRGDAKVGQVDDWFTVTASRLTPLR